MRRFFRTDWRTWLAFAFAVAMVFIVVDRERLAEARDEAKSAESAGQEERARLLAGQKDLQEQVDRLVSQNNALVELFRTSGIEVPAEYVASPGSVTRIETSGDDDDDDGGDTTIVVRPTTAPTSRPPTTPPPDDDDGGTRVDLPDVPLPPEAGEATDTAKRIVDDLTGIELD